MMLGHLIGAFISAFLSDLGHKQSNVIVVLILNSFVSGVSCIIASASSNIIVLKIALTLWSLSAEMILNFLNMIPMLFFPPSMVKRIFSLIVISLPMYSVILPLAIRLHLSWRMTLLLNMGIPHLLWVIYVWYNFRQLTNIKISEIETI
jgi:hypothetical protein